MIRHRNEIYVNFFPHLTEALKLKRIKLLKKATENSGPTLLSNTPLLHFDQNGNLIIILTFCVAALLSNLFFRPDTSEV